MSAVKNLSTGLPVILCLITALGLAFVHQADAQLFRVTSIKISVDPSTFTGQCPHTFKFTAQIEAQGRGKLRYRWVRSDGVRSQENTLGFDAANRQTITYDWTLGTNGQNYEGMWCAVEILDPQRMISDRATFTLHCSSMRVQMPTTEIRGMISPIDGTRSSLEGRRVKIILKQSGRTIFTQEKALDNTGRCDYRFSSTALWGDYLILVEKGRMDPENYANKDVDYCFEGTVPSEIRLTVDASHRVHRDQDFQFRYHVRMGAGVGNWCW